MTDTISFNKLAGQYKAELLDSVIPFWLEKSPDREYGGYYTCLTRDGKVFDTDKFLWLQGRQVWMFATLYNQVEQRGGWLECAVHGAEFLKKYGHDGEYNWYFSLNREGKPLVQPYNIFSYTFAAMAFAQLNLATGKEEYAEIARRTLERILEKEDNPKAQWNKAVPGTRDLKNFALPMIMSNLALEMEHLLDREFLDETVDRCIRTVMEEFYDPESGLILESIDASGRLSDSFEGRLVNPGHAIEAMWFIMDLATRQQRPELIKKANEIALHMLDYGWDAEYGGIFYFMDRLGHPPQQLEWDQKLWWVHMESLITTLKGYQLLGEQENLEWFQRIHDYSWKNFRDPEHPEWFGYLNRRGEVLLPLKGGKWKGCFHVPRGLLNCWQILEKID
jgi:N-acylglucosamine 2-epimerase